MTFDRRFPGGGLPRPTRAVIWAILVGLMLVAGRAQAMTYYLSPSGNDANSGSLPGLAWATLSKANSTVAPGDVVIIANGTYSGYPAPARSGTSTQRITYVGSLSSPGSVTITGNSNFSASYVTLKGLNLLNAFTITGTHDSLAYCSVGGDRATISVASDCVVARCSITCQRFWFMGGEVDTVTKAYRDTVTDCSFVLSPVSTAGHTVRLKNLEYCVLNRSRFTISIGSGAVGASTTKLFFVKHTKFTDCSWNATNACISNCDEAGWFVVRDFTQDNSWVRDTVTLKGPGQAQFMASCSGSYPGTVMNNNYDHCIFKAPDGTVLGAAFSYQDAARTDTLSYCTFIGSGSGISFGQPILGPMLIDHCTVVGFNPSVGGAFNDADATSSSWQGNVTLQNNIYYLPPTAPRDRNHAPFSSRVSYASGHITARNNLFYSPMVSDSSIVTEVGPSRPGSGFPWCQNTGADCNSSYGSPNFVNVSSVLSFDPHLQNGSLAIGGGTGGSDIGAYPFGSGGPDLTPPATVSSLAATFIASTDAILQWVAPGDDGTVGTASAYDLRWSNQPITAANFASATPVTAPPLTAAAGTAQSYVALPLLPGQTYYFALRTVDDAGNWSAISNVVTFDTPASDVVPPSSVTNLR